MAGDVIKIFKKRKLAYEILIAFLILVVLIVFIYGLGIYKYNWSRYGVRTMAKIVPYPAGFAGPFWLPLSKFYQMKDFIEHFYIKTGTPIEETSLNQQIIDQIIEQKLVEREFKRQGLFISQKEFEDEYKKIVEENQGEEKVKEMLEDLYDMSLSEFKNLIKEKLVIEKFKNEVLVSAHVEHILIKLPENRDEGALKYYGDRTWEILNQINGGGNWQDLAKKFSNDENSKDKGGDLGWLQRGGIVSGKPMPKEFENGVFSLNVGQISAAPVLTEFGYHIFKVTEKKGKIDKSYQDWLSETKSKTWIKKFVGE